MANINKPLSQMTFSQAENLARQRNLTPDKYGATLAGTWTNQGLADALGVSIVKPSRSVYSSGQKVLATPTALKPPPTRADVLSQAQSLGDTTYGITQSPYNAATDVARTRYLNQVLPGKMTPLKAMAQGVGVTPEELNAAYLAGQQKGQQRDTTWTQTKAELDSRGAPDWFKVASALAGAHMGAQNLGSNIISDPAVHLSDAAKVGLSAYSGYKSPENISTKQILDIALPIPTLAEGGLVGYAGGGQYSATGIRPTPEQRPVVGALARMVQGVDKFARAPFGYTNPPVEAISDFLRVPELYRTMENYAYGSPLASGTSPVSRYLPRLSEDTKGAIEASLNLVPLVGPTMRATKATARAAAPYAAQQAVNLVEKYGVAPTMNVIKPKGGNWLTGDIEYALKPLRSTAVGEEPAERLKKLEDYFADQRAKGVALDYSALDRERARTAPDVAINRWIDNKLNKYIRNEMATPEDPVRALAERGITHAEVAPADTYGAAHLGQRREAVGFPKEGMGRSEQARAWEAAADDLIHNLPAGERINVNTFGEDAALKALKENPWLQKVPPETMTYGVYPNIFEGQTQFGHLIDELKAAMSPTSELPQHLRLDPKDIDKVTVPQAVERVSKINAWRAEQAAQAEKAGMMANLQATPRLADESLQLSFVEKPGGAWVDIPETVDEKGMKLCTSIGKAGGWCTQADWAAESHGSGDNRLTALVDTEGRPHAQAKITENDWPVSGEGFTRLDPQTKAQYGQYVREWRQRNPEIEELTDEDVIQALKEAGVQGPAPDITELKPVGNSFSSERAQEYAKRDPQYKNKVTQSVLNFLNSGEWGRVADLHHYDIVDLKDPNKLLEGLMTLYGDERAGSHRVGQEFIDAFNHAVGAEPNAPRFMTPRQLREFIGPIEPLEGYAEGGKAKDDNPFEGLEPTFGSKAGAYISDKTTEGLLWLYDKLAERDKLSSAHKILLDTFVHDKRDPITAKDFNPQDLAELENLIKQKEKLSGNKGVGYIEYKDYGALPGGDRTPSRRAGLVSGDLTPRPSLSNSLGQFNYKLDPKTNRYVIIDEYDFNPQRIEHMGKKHDVPLEHYGDYAVNALSSPSTVLHGLVRLYAGRKMPPGKGRKVDLSVPGKAEGGLMKYDPDEVVQLAASVAPGYAAGGLVNYDPAEIDTIVSRIREELHG